jgi:hypothetical protein
VCAALAAIKHQLHCWATQTRRVPHNPPCQWPSIRSTHTVHYCTATSNQGEHPPEHTQSTTAKQQHIKKNILPSQGLRSRQPSAPHHTKPQQAACTALSVAAHATVRDPYNYRVPNPHHHPLFPLAGPTGAGTLGHSTYQEACLPAGHIPPPVPKCGTHFKKVRYH